MSSEPEPPTGVWVDFGDGRVAITDLTYDGVDPKDHTHRWIALTPWTGRNATQAGADHLPAMTSIHFAFLPRGKE